jgi:RimJ/RimL family protein N-acetyltransferase
MITLRGARGDDAYALWLWANDPDSRAASGDRAVISWADHLRWFGDRSSSPNARILIAENAEGRPVGCIRFETVDGWVGARLSYVVAPEARGNGIGGAILHEGTAALLRLRPAVVIEALVRGSNAPSVKLFQRMGWRGEPVAGGRLRFRSAEAAR